MRRDAAALVKILLSFIIGITSSFGGIAIEEVVSYFVQPPCRKYHIK
jgi:hypothetical protein